MFEILSTLGEFLVRIVVVPMFRIFERGSDAKTLESDMPVKVPEIVVLESQWTPQGLYVRFRNDSELAIPSVCFRVKAFLKSGPSMEFEERFLGAVSPGEVGDCVLVLTHATTELYPMDFRSCTFQVAAIYGTPS
ncbi:MAG: hypothetical protein KIS92_10180 [Planctomycetota bacterium]|nr:hypothetical protein [Planctomycetota bacterium]